jgi:hypothetical protein
MFCIDNTAVTLRAHEILKKYTVFLTRAGFNPPDYAIDYAILKNAVRRYWIDVERLKYFHPMQRINSHKIAGYLTYWLCKFRPIIVKNKYAYLNNSANHLKHPHYINELFAACLGLGRLNEDRKKQNTKGVIMPPGLFDTFTYGLKYRVLTGDMLSMMYEIFDGASPK